MIQLKNTVDNPKGICAYLLFEEDYEEKQQSSLFTELKNKDVFSGKKDSFYTTSFIEDHELKTICLLGLGKRKELTEESLRMAVAKATKQANKLKERELAFFLDQIFMKDKWIRAIGEGLTLAQYAFDKYLSDKKEKTLDNIVLAIPAAPSFKDALDEGIFLGAMTIEARELTNEPGDVVTPIYLANKAKELGKGAGFSTTIYDKKAIEKLKMNAFLAVASGSNFEPVLIVMKYTGNPNGETLGLVGKGITFDTGGLSLKPANSMLTMQGDMGGAASVLTAIGAIAEQKLPINVTAVVAACDNAISGKSYRPNDILISRSGKTIFIANTDAEGRLTLIDAVDYILTEKKVDYIVDIATLTGAAEIALGQKIAPTVTNNEAFYKKLKKASKVTGERTWELPHDEDYLELIKSPYADLTNSGGRFAGTITAGLFIGAVVGETPWIHIDIAGPSWTEKDTGYFSKGATGFGTRLLYQLAKEMSNG